MQQFSDVPPDAQVIHAPGYSDLPEGAEVVGAESNADKLRRILKQRTSAPLPQVSDYSTVHSGAGQSLRDLASTFNPVENVIGAAETVAGAVRGAYEMRPQNPTESIHAAIFPSTYLAQKGYLEPAMAVQGQANAAAIRGDMPEATLKATAAPFPIVGPGVASVYDLAMGGQPGRAYGSGVTQVAMMKTPEIIDAIKSRAAAARTTPGTPGYSAETSPLAAKQAEILGKNAALESKQAGQEVIGNAREALTKRIKGNVEETHAAVRSSLDTRWQAMRDTVGQAPADPATLAKVEADARASNLSGATPDAIAKFESVMDKVRTEGATPEAALEQKVAEGLGYKDARQARARVPAQAFDGMVERLKAEGLTDVPANNFGELQNRYTRLGEELSKGNLPNETFRALKQVREGYGQHMQEIADKAGVGGELTKLKGDWSQYMEDFRNSDSPVARALAAKDLPVVTKNAAGNTHARFAEIMGRNKAHGGNPVLVQELAGLKAREAALKAAKPQPVPTKAASAARPSRLRTLLGGVVGAGVGSIAGHPVLGYYAGKEAARATARK